MSYKSPIDVFITQVRLEQEKNLEDSIYKAVQALDIYVTKDELLKALKYDRGQYEKGYQDGYNADKWINCADRLPNEGDRVLVWFRHFRYGNPACPIQGVGIGFTYRDKWVVDDKAYCGLQVYAWQPIPTRPTKFAIITKGDTND